MPRSDRQLPDRRKAFKKMGKWLLAGGGAMTAAYVVLGREGPIDEWVTVGAVNSLPVGEIQARSVAVTAHGRWFDQHVERAIWLLRDANDVVTVFSGVCPHKSYNINWRRELGSFVCPGHKSAFAPSGQVLAGPSPRPLDALEHRVEDGMLQVRYVKFKSSTAAKEVFT